MKLLRIKIRSWTASFRYPIFVAGFQPTLPMPPLSTIYGLISAAKGNIVTPEETSVGYVFSYQAKAVDLETIYEIEGLKAKSNVANREFLFDNELYLYLTNLDLESVFRRPHHPILLGRSTELAMIEEVKILELKEKTGVKVGKTLMPIPAKGFYGALQALPTHFSDEVNRKALGTKPFLMVEEMITTTENPVPFDEEKKWGVFLHQ
ncbi:MAG: type I-B CRISPR-associated protein Cas5 [Chlorobi bacterium]|uniref:CRISPR-associated protein Cas5 family n=1 Tax=Chlorobium limicola (strain DSM 245 / NBRC 103803 / 6330) TaxID=290315 RepID=B3EG03_CHLL2|nr:type I-B CRISPR-associated protein Cas5b [Chlorobium limicola]ACD89536.1 CRISPR-associated protein Cas5 family [Chlorobium limicola DSM 245]MBM3423403.1 type I-B CRISPR-associated protein Cas5 [Chlorobiota bacterium]